MPTYTQPSSKRPGILAWLGFGILAVIALLAITKILSSVVTKTTSDIGISKSGYGTAGMMPIYNDSVSDLAARQELASPSAAPSYLANNTIEAISAETKGIGSAAPAGDSSTMQRVIKTGEISLRVTDAPKAVEDIKALATGKGGFVESSSISDSGSGPRSAWMTVRIPVTTFDETMKALKQVGVLVLNESVHGQDVTEEFVDLESDVRNAKAEEASYIEIMKRSGKIEETLQVARALAEVRGRIERLEGRKRYLENRTDLSTISVSLTEETRVEVPSRTWRPYEVLKQSLSQLVISLQALVNFLISAVVAIIGLLLPIAAIVLLVMWVGWKIIRAFLRRMNKR